MNIRSACLWLFCAGIGFAQEEKSDPPGDDARLKAEKQIRDIFKDEYAARTPAAQKKLAALLLQQGRDTKDDPTLRYVLCREAAEVATRSGDCDTLLGSLDTMCGGFKVDSVGLRASYLLKAEPAVSAAEDLKKLTEALLQLTRDASAQDQFDAASRAAQASVGTARKSKDLALVVRAEAMLKSVQEAKSACEKSRAAEQVLTAAPEDPAASQARGEYLCFFKDQWEAGLRLLSKGSDPALKALASKELAAPADLSPQLEIADGWWDLAAADKSPQRKSRIRSHARSLYERALPASTGLLRLKIESRLSEAASGQSPLETPVEPTREGLVAWWKCDEGKGATIADSAGAGHDATLVNVEWVPGHSGTGLRFNGKTSYVACKAANLPATHAPQTISWWHYRLTAATNGNVIMLSNDAQTAAVELSMGKEKVAVWKLGGEPVLSAPDLKLAVWTHCAYSFDGKTHVLYINGKREASCEVPPQTGTPTRCEFGRWWGPVGSGYYGGLLDDVRIYNRALPDSEIKTLAASRD